MSKKRDQPIDLGFLQEQAGRTDLSGMFAASVSTESDMQQAIMVKIERLLNNPYQPRLEMQDQGIEELAQVIRAQGFQGVLVGRPDPVNKGFYQLTAGHRRREAARRAGLASLPLVVRELTDEEMVTLAITENIQREDLTPLEEGKIYLLMSDEMGYTQEQIAREIGRERGYVVNRLRVARAPRDIQALVQAKPDSLRMVANLIKVKSEEDRADIIAHILSGELTVEDLPGYIQSKSAHQPPVSSKSSGSTSQPPRDDPTLELRPPNFAFGELVGPALPQDNPEPETQGLGLERSERQELSEAPQSDMSPDRRPKDDMRSTPSRQVTGDRVLSPETRIGTAKLAAVLRYLNTYKSQAASRQVISSQERAAIGLIKEIIEDLQGRFPEEDSDKLLS
ncbi:MAG: ParB/RepB/Spo0J family partition protein [Chloroflexia bacterium]